VRYHWTRLVETFLVAYDSGVSSGGLGTQAPIGSNRVGSGPMAMCGVSLDSSCRDLSNDIWVKGVRGR
jgi:hypothetical protein